MTAGTPQQEHSEDWIDTYMEGPPAWSPDDLDGLVAGVPGSKLWKFAHLVAVCLQDHDHGGSDSRPGAECRLFVSQDPQFPDWMPGLS